MQRTRCIHKVLTGLILFSLIVLQPKYWGVSASNAAPALIGLLPSEALAGTPALAITLGGLNFQDGAVAVWSLAGTPSDMPAMFVSDTELTAELPVEAIQLAGVLQISVRNPDAQESNTLDFTVRNPVPVLSSLTPDHVLTADSDTVLTLTGSGFVPSSVVFWNNIELPTTSLSDTKLQANLTAALLVRDGTANIAVQNPAPGGGFSGILSFAIQPHSNIWLPHSPEGGEIHDIEFDPSDPAIVYAGTESAGVFKSIDGGQSWASANGGMWPGLRAFCVAVSPTNPADVLAVTDQSTWGSHDGGNSWAQVGGLGSAIGFSDCAAFDPTSSDIAYAGTTMGLWATYDGWKTWQDIGKYPGHYVGQVIVTGPGTLYELDAPTDNSHTVWKTTNGGQSWTEMTNGLPDNLVNAIGADPTNPPVLYAATWGYSSSPDTGVYKTEDAGASWHRVLAENHFYTEIVVNKDDPQRVLVATEDGFLSSADAGTTWTFLPLNRREITRLAIDYAHAGRLVAGGERGISLSRDLGATWSPSNTGLTAQQVVDLAYGVPTHTLYAATYQGGVWSSIDYGSTWSHLSLDTKYLHQVLIDPNDTTHLLVASNFGNFETTDSGQTWTPFGQMGLGNNVFGPNSNLLYSPGWYDSGDGIVYGGTSEPQKITPACAKACHVDTIVPDPMDAGTIYVVVSIYADPTHYLYVSHDGGHSWSEAGIALGSTSYAELAIDPLDTSVLYLAMQDGLYKSTDRAATWQSLGVTNLGWVTEMVVDPLNDQVLHSAGSGIHRSIDAGKSWTYVGAATQIPPTVWAVQPLPPEGTGLAEGTLTTTGQARASVLSGAGNGVYAFFSVDASPTALALSNKLVADRMPSGTTVGTFTTTDSNSEDQFKYALVRGTGGGDNASFHISGNKLLTAKVLSRSVRGAYSIRVRSTDSGGLFLDRNFVITLTPNTPSLLTPAQNLQLKYNRPLFDWSDVGTILTYTLQVSSNSHFTTPVIAVNAAASQYTPGKSLPVASTFYWRVRSNFASGPGPWSGVKSFHTANPPGTAVLLLPANGATLNTFTPRLTWSRVKVPVGINFDHYEIQIATASNFKAPVLDAPLRGISSTAFKPLAPLAIATRYYWRVRSFNTFGQYSDWSTVWLFWTGP